MAQENNELKKLPTDVLSAPTGEENTEGIPDIPFNVDAELLNSFQSQSYPHCPEYTTAEPADVPSDPRLRSRIERTTAKETATVPAKKLFNEVSGHSDELDDPAEKRGPSHPKTSESDSLLLTLLAAPFIPSHLPGV